MKLKLSKTTVTKLSDQQMKKFVGGLRGGGGQSCDTNSCDSQRNAGSCNSNSCNCAAEIDSMF